MLSLSDRARAMWRRVLASAFRTALACTIVGGATLYGPSWLQRLVAFPAFSYVTVILIITNATLGDTLRGCWLALYATCQSVGPAVLSLWLIGPSTLTAGTTAIAVALAGLLVVLPDRRTHLVAKRIALGQIVITYVVAYINGPKTEVVMHPLRVAASTAIGVAACVLAMLLPYPCLASSELKQSCKLLAENTSGRLKLYVKAFFEEDKTSAIGHISQAEILSRSASKFHQAIKRYQPSMKWERIPYMFLATKQYMNIGDKLQDVETTLRGIEMAVTSSNISSYPTRLLLEGEAKQDLLNLEMTINPTVKKVSNLLQASDPLTEDPKSDSAETLRTLQEIPATHQDLSSYFFLFCLKLLQNKPIPKPMGLGQKSKKKLENSSKNVLHWKNVWKNLRLASKRLMPSIKISLSLGLSVFFGSVYSKENGFWSGLPVAISLAATREATFKIANVKAQGTVIGTVYGVMGCFVFERFLPIRFLSLLPWFIFSSFLSRSRMYDQAGGISAAIGAVLILGRKNFGPPSEFAIKRIVETFIGLSCSIAVELLLEPARASSLAKLEISRSFHRLQDCVRSLGFESDQADLFKLKTHLKDLKKFIEEAESEPSFWFLPFNASCYHKLFGSLSKISDLLHFSAQAIGFLGEQETQKQIMIELDNDLKLFRESIGSLMQSFQEITLIRSLDSLEKNSTTMDLEKGKPENPNLFRVSGSKEDEEEKVLNSYLEHSREVIDKIHNYEVKRRMVLSLSAFGYCMKSLMEETREIEERFKELDQWENPSSHGALHEVSCQARALFK